MASADFVGHLGKPGKIRVRDYIVEVLVNIFLHRLRPVARNIDICFGHGFNRSRIDRGRVRSRAKGFEAVTSQRAKQTLGHLAAARVAGAEN